MVTARDQGDGAMGSARHLLGNAAVVEQAGAPALRRTLIGRRRGGSPGDVPVIVVARGPTGLGTLRSLRIAGITAYVACPPGDLVTRSRWYRPVPGGSGWDGSVGPHVPAILRAMPLARAVLIPGRDDAALWLADLPHGDLADRFRVSSSPRASLEILQDKSRFGQFLSHTSMPHPRTFTIGSAADIDTIPFDELDRVFIKPVDSQRFSQVLGAKGLWAADRAEFEAIWRSLDQRGFQVIAQEYVPGSAADHYFIDGFRDRAGALTGLFARRRQRIYPADFGNSSYCESVPLAELGAAVGQLEALLADLRYRGIFSAEFKRDARCGTLRILEVNTRAWWYVEFAARCGVNVCRMAHEDALDRPVVPATKAYAVGAGCVNLDGDIKAVLGRGAHRAEPVARTVAKWARAHCHVYRWDDPWPALSGLWERLRQRWAHRHAPPPPAGQPMAPDAGAAGGCDSRHPPSPADANRRAGAR